MPLSVAYAFITCIAEHRKRSVPTVGSTLRFRSARSHASMAGHGPHASMMGHGPNVSKPSLPSLSGKVRSGRQGAAARHRVAELVQKRLASASAAHGGRGVTLVFGDACDDSVRNG